MEKAERAEEPRAVSLQHVAKPGPIWMVLVDEKEAVIVAQLTYKRPRVLQPVAERLLTDDVHSRLRGSETMLAVQPGRRHDVDKIKRPGLPWREIGEQAVQCLMDIGERGELRPAFFGATSRWIDERYDFDFRDPLPAAEMELGNHAAADDRSAQFHPRIVPPSARTPSTCDHLCHTLSIRAASKFSISSPNAARKFPVRSSDVAKRLK